MGRHPLQILLEVLVVTTSFKQRNSSRKTKRVNNSLSHEYYLQSHRSGIQRYWKLLNVLKKRRLSIWWGTTAVVQHWFWQETEVVSQELDCFGSDKTSHKYQTRHSIDSSFFKCRKFRGRRHQVDVVDLKAFILMVFEKLQQCVFFFCFVSFFPKITRYYLYSDKSRVLDDFLVPNMNSDNHWQCLQFNGLDCRGGLDGAEAWSVITFEVPILQLRSSQTLITTSSKLSNDSKVAHYTFTSVVVNNTRICLWLIKCRHHHLATIMISIKELSSRFA